MDAVDQVPQREALKVCLYLGGQRPTQLLRAQVTDIDIDAGSITIHDKKGRRRNGPRRHMVPLIKEASVILEARLAAIRGIMDRRAAIGDHRQVPVFPSNNATPMWPILLPALERHGHLKLKEAIRSKVLAMSAAMIDRLLRTPRSAARPHKRRRAVPGPRRRVPLRTFADWNEPIPGSRLCPINRIAEDPTPVYAV